MDSFPAPAMINTYKALLDLCSRITSSACVALDTEFDTGNRPGTILSVVQVGLNDREAYLIDALAIEDLKPLTPMLEDEGIIKIMHDAGQDLGLIADASDAIPKNIFDVQVAARLLGMGTHYSLSELAQTTLGIHLSKSQQRSDWLRRPLSENQINYARKDVLHLHQIRKILLVEAEKTGRSEWIEEEMHSFNDPASYTPLSDAERILSIPAVHNLTPGQCAAIAEIADWREYISEVTGQFPRRLLKDGEVFRLAKKRCIKPSAVRNCCSSLPRCYEKELANLIAKALNTPENACPAPLSPRPRTGAETAQLHLLQAVVTSRAFELGIHTELIGTTSTLIDFVLNPENTSHPLKKGWRWKVIGQDLSDILRGKSFVELHDDKIKVHPLPD